MEQDLAEEAQSRARSLSLTFSAYVVQLIRRDLMARGQMTISETPASSQLIPPRQPDTKYPKPAKKPRKPKD